MSRSKRPRHQGAGSRGRAPRRERREDREDGKERLQKVLAAAGVGSRRDCEELITEGRIEVDRQVVTELGTRVDPVTQEIRVDGEALRRPKRLYYVVNKPMGVVTTNYDQAGRPRVVDLVPTEERVFAVGRLDLHSEGLILVTNDGEFANRITHPRYGVQKIYLVRVAGEPGHAELMKLRRGVHLSDGFCKVDNIRIKSRHKQSTDLIMVLNEGRNRELRRVLARVGNKVLRLKRIAIGPLKLGDLPTGAWRRLLPQEIETLLAESRKKRKPAAKPPSRAAKSERAEAAPLSDQQVAEDEELLAPDDIAAFADGGPMQDFDVDADFIGDDALLLGDDDELEDEGDDELGIEQWRDDEMEEITDDAGASFERRPPRGDVIDYGDEDEASPPPRAPAGPRPGSRRKQNHRPKGRRQARPSQQATGDEGAPPREDFGRGRHGKRLLGRPIKGRKPPGKPGGRPSAKEGRSGTSRPAGRSDGRGPQARAPGGASTGGRTTGGRAGGGRPASGRPASGRPTGGRPTAGKGPRGSGPPKARGNAGRSPGGNRGGGRKGKR